MPVTTTHGDKARRRASISSLAMTLDPSQRPLACCRCSKSVRYILNIFLIGVIIFLVLQYGIGLVLTRDYHRVSYLVNASVRHDDAERSVEDVIRRWKATQLTRNATETCASVPPKLGECVRGFAISSTIVISMKCSFCVHTQSQTCLPLLSFPSLAYKL